MMKLTEKEIMLLNKITESNFFNGDPKDEEDLKDLVIWTDCLLDESGMSVKSAKGVLGSLVRKELVNVSGGYDSCVSLTDEGVKFLLESNEVVDEVEETKEEMKEETETKVEEKVEEMTTKESENKAKHIFRAYDPEGQMKFESHLLKDVVDFSMKNGIASRGWVNLSIRRNIPVLIGLGYDAEIPEDFTPRVTSKYSGNYWKFTKEEVESVKDNNIDEDEVM